MRSLRRSLAVTLTHKDHGDYRGLLPLSLFPFFPYTAPSASSFGGCLTDVTIKE